jgi:hypothetical protein
MRGLADLDRLRKGTAGDGNRIRIRYPRPMRDTLRGGLALVLVCALWACGKKDAATGKTQDPVPKKTYECAKDSDCAVSCTLPDSCCGQGCECTRAYHKDELAAITTSNRKKCESGELSRDCPVYSCKESTHHQVPLCRNKKCVAQPAKMCDQDTDCVLSCNIWQRCCGDPCDCEYAFHKDDLAVHDEWQKANCQDAVCKDADCAESEHEMHAKCDARTCQAVPEPPEPPQ